MSTLLHFLRSLPHLRSSVAALFAGGLLALPGCTNDSEPGGQAGSGPVGAAGSGGSGGAAAGGAASGGAGGTSGAGGAGSGGETALHMPWEWTGIIGTGQSLSVGEPDGVRNTAAAAARL